nr:hypothetical protein [Salinispora sp. H7-4]
MQQFPAYPLELLVDGEADVVVVAAVLAVRLAMWRARLVPAVPLDVFPGESEDFALAESEHEDQDVGGVEVVVPVAGRFEERAGLFAVPRLALAVADRWQLHQGCHVLGEQLLDDSLSECRTENSTDSLDCPGRGKVLPTPTHRAALSLVVDVPLFSGRSTGRGEVRFHDLG